MDEIGNRGLGRLTDGCGFNAVIEMGKWRVYLTVLGQGDDNAVIGYLYSVDDMTSWNLGGNYRFKYIKMHDFWRFCLTCVEHPKKDF